MCFSVLSHARSTGSRPCDLGTSKNTSGQQKYPHGDTYGHRRKACHNMLQVRVCWFKTSGRATAREDEMQEAKRQEVQVERNVVVESVLRTGLNRSRKYFERFFD